MTKFKTGRPPRRPKQLPSLATLPPLANMTRCTLYEAAVYLRCSKPKIYELIKSGLLESRTNIGRRYVTTDSIKRVLEGNQHAPKRPPKFVAIRITPDNGGKRSAREAA